MIAALLKYKLNTGNWARIRKYDRGQGLRSPLHIFDPTLPKYCLYFKTVFMYFIYPATLYNILRLKLIPLRKQSKKR